MSSKRLTALTGTDDRAVVRVADERRPALTEPRRYVTGQCRNSPEAKPHVYLYDVNGDLWPMCEYGWNRSDGQAFSIFRSPGTNVECGICRRAVAQRKDPVWEAKGHPTRWL